MIKRIAAIWLCLCMVMAGASLCVTAAPLERSVLVPEKTASPGNDAVFTYSEQGVLTVTAAGETGGAVAVTLDQLLHVRNLRYLQVSLTSNAPFNVALKISGTEKDIYPQFAGPSWYEAFAADRPDDAMSIPAGQYTLSLDLVHYFEYNGLTIDKNGYVNLKTVLIMLDGAGTMTIDRLALSNTQEFSTASGQTGAAAPTLPVLEEIHETDVTQPEGEWFEQPDYVIESEDKAFIIIMVLIGAGTLIVVLIIAAVVKVKTDAAIQKEDERYFRLADEAAKEMEGKTKKKKRVIYSPDRPRPVKSKSEYLQEFKLLGAKSVQSSDEETVETEEQPTEEQSTEEQPVEEQQAPAQTPPKPKKKKHKKKKKK